MRYADYVEETTTSIAGTSGDGAVTTTAVTNRPRFSTVFGTGATLVKYIIEDTVNMKLEAGVGSIASNVLTRTHPQITWDGTTWSANAPSALQFGSSPTSGDIRIRMAALAEDVAANMPGVQSTLAGDTTWRDYPWSEHLSPNATGSSFAPTSANEYYFLYKMSRGGALSGIQYNITSANSVASIKLALYDMSYTALPAQKICDFVTSPASSTGIKTDTSVSSWTPSGPVWINPGWYCVGLMASAPIALDGQTPASQHTPFGKYTGTGGSFGCTVAGSYTNGLPAAPNLSGGSLLNPTTATPIFGLKVVP